MESPNSLAHLDHAPALIRGLAKAVDWSVIGIGAVMIALVFLNVSLHVIGKDLAWVTELGEFLMVWVTFLGGVAAGHRGLHMSIFEFLDKLNPPLRKAADLAIHALCIGVLGLLLFYGAKIVKSGWGSTLTTLEWSMGWQYLPLPLSAALMLCFALWDTFRTYHGDSRELRYGDQ
jgi:TRAP-type transport system small permease protein